MLSGPAMAISPRFVSLAYPVSGGGGGGGQLVLVSVWMCVSVVCVRESVRVLVEKTRRCIRQRLVVRAAQLAMSCVILDRRMFLVGS